MNEGYQEFFKQYGYAQQRVASTAETAAAGRDVSLFREAQDRLERAVTAWNALKPFDPTKRQYEKLLKDDPAAANALRDRWIKDQAQLMTPESAQTSGGRPSQAATPQPLPASRDPKDFKDGVIYQTNRGPARWDAKGQQFVAE
jgi:hypothetical protein